MMPMTTDHTLLIARIESHLNQQRGGDTISLGTDYDGAAKMIHTHTMLLTHHPFIGDEIELTEACRRVARCDDTPYYGCTVEELIGWALENNENSPHLISLVTDGREVRVSPEWVEQVEELVNDQ
jgi:hypothetical protein